MNNVTRFPRKCRVPPNAQQGPWDTHQKSATSPLWVKASLAFVGAVVAAQFGIWQFREYRIAHTDSISGTSSLSTASAFSGDRESASFGFCHEGGGTNCVVDGDTLYYQGTKIRIAEIDTPETHDPQCAYEAALGAEATRRLYALINAGPFTLVTIDRDEDQYGRKLRILTRGGQSLGETLVNEGLARRYEGGRRPWC